MSFEVSKVVRIACGPISSGDKDSSARRSPFQHALTLTILDILGKKFEKRGQIKCFAQDPAYTDLDKLVLGDPEAFLKVEDSTVVISCAADLPSQAHNFRSRSTGYDYMG